MRIEQSKRTKMGKSPDKAVHPEIKELQELSDQLTDAVVSATYTIPCLTQPALAAALPVVRILQKMETEAASGGADALDEIRGKIPMLTTLVHDLIDEFATIAKARDKDEFVKFSSKLPSDTRRILDWYYGDAITE